MFFCFFAIFFFESGYGAGVRWKGARGQWVRLGGTWVQCRMMYNPTMVQVSAGRNVYSVEVAIVRCSRSAHQCLTSVSGFYFARFAAAWVWGSCQTVFVGFATLNIFLLYMRLSFSIMICSLW